MFPELCEPSKEDPHTTLAIDLPPAPDDVQANLVRAQAAGLNLTLHVEGEAIAFADNPTVAFFEERAGRYEEIGNLITAREEAERRQREAERAWFDPIVTNPHGSATAIIAQYGDFPIEKELIDTVVTSSALV